MAAKTQPAVSHRVIVALARTGETERAEHKKINLSVSLKVGNKTVLASEKFKL